MTDGQAAGGRDVDRGPVGAEAGDGDAVRILALVSSGHAVSSFYILSLPPLLIYLKTEFAVSYTLLGAMLSLRSIVSGVFQMPVGFLADRYGGKRVLTVGLLVMSAAFGGLALAPNIWWCMVMMVLFGFGLATIRPSNYAIIASSIPHSWMGRAFGINVFGGHVGRSIAPPLIIGLTALWGWRAAVLVAAGLGLVITFGIITQWRKVRDDAGRKKKGDGAGFFEEVKMLASRTTLLFFMFYLLNAVASNGINSFSIAALSELHDTPLAVASSALTGYLIAGAAGVLLGGFAVDQTYRHQLFAAVALVGAAGMVFLMGTVSMPLVLLVAVMSLAGAFQGAIRPARDLMLRDAMPREAFGKAAGMVTTGASIGSSMSPLLFGFILDMGEPQLVFYIIGILMLAVAATAIAPKEKVRYGG
ncbi:MAG: hypothetical protein RLZ98_1860 [Pseudomonadota bacterium]|jgi:MFS family permease